jgi:hypothetical protein
LGAVAAAAHAPASKSLFASFSTEKEVLALLTIDKLMLPQRGNKNDNTE